MNEIPVYFDGGLEGLGGGIRVEFKYRGEGIFQTLRVASGPGRGRRFVACDPRLFIARYPLANCLALVRRRRVIPQEYLGLDLLRPLVIDWAQSSGKQVEMPGWPAAMGILDLKAVAG